MLAKLVERNSGDIMNKIILTIFLALTTFFVFGQKSQMDIGLPPINKIKTKVSRETNYVFHILSVAKCGYDNEYGNQYASYHSVEDLKILKRYERLITVKGGEYTGELYGLVILPARLDIEAARYYESLGHLFETGSFEENIRKHKEIYNYFLCENEEDLLPSVRELYNVFQQHREAIVMICDVMRRNYAIYCDKIWEKSKAELLPYAKAVEDIFVEKNLSHTLEKLTNVSLQNDFTATFVNSISGGAEAIDISKSLDVFGIGRDHQDAVKFISHEFVIYLLIQAFENKETFVKYWIYTEGLAEFYLTLVGLESGYFSEVQHIIEFYKKIYQENNNLSALELFQKAKKEFEKE